MFGFRAVEDPSKHCLDMRTTWRHYEHNKSIQTLLATQMWETMQKPTDVGKQCNKWLNIQCYADKYKDMGKPMWKVSKQWKHCNTVVTESCKTCMNNGWGSHWTETMSIDLTWTYWAECPWDVWPWTILISLKRISDADTKTSQKLDLEKEPILKGYKHYNRLDGSSNGSTVYTCFGLITNGSIHLLLPQTRSIQLKFLQGLNIMRFKSN